ncbi:GT2D2 protein, partial [Acromyrmex charruanus]
MNTYLSAKTVTSRGRERIADINDSIRDELKCKYFSLCFDESTDIRHTSQLSIFIQIIQEDYSCVEELLDFVVLRDTTIGLDIFLAVKETDIDFGKCSSITIDGARAVTGLKKGFAVRSVYTDVPPHCPVRWFSTAKSSCKIQVFFAIRKDILLFLKEINNSKFQKDVTFLTELAFISDIIYQLRLLNLKLQRMDHFLDSLIDEFDTPIEGQHIDLQDELCDLQNDISLKTAKETDADFYKMLKESSYPKLCDFGLRIHFMFGSTYLCETSFLKMKLIENGRRSSLSDESLPLMNQWLIHKQDQIGENGFIGYPRSILYDIAQKYTDAKKSEEDFINPARQSYLRKSIPCLTARTPAVIQYTSYVFKIWQMLSENVKAKRVNCNLFLYSLTHKAADRFRFFSDKIFTADAKVNRRDDRRLAHNPQHVPVITRTKFPTNIYVLSVVSNESDIIPPYLKNWLFYNVDMFWSKEFCPPNSPNLNPLDYFVWDVPSHINLLEISIINNGNKIIIDSKEIFSGKCLSFFSNHPTCQKRNSCNSHIIYKINCKNCNTYVIRTRIQFDLYHKSTFSIFGGAKDPLPTSCKKNVVYKISCKDCDATYIGQTGRQLKTEISKHRSHINRNITTHSVIINHRLHHSHDFCWEDIKILDNERNYKKMINIKQQNNSISLKTDIELLNQAYLNYFNLICFYY